ncbi:MAG: hypothetical protein AVDCRST_MAG53-1468 [uncultured Solirubrobacteraceae bacterium]|uniref:Uncharacterized protein n=1 Tax=uncultured Solirubrobacteraceae bacterium TaxID=1162706 RepID=A0A6J4S7B7_9ACTN|nr:MAG: hypothetical protein AVDCRST_MAG53-1468 [uncultured Solirubrobacteraceae bacterium]
MLVAPRQLLHAGDVQARRRQILEPRGALTVLADRADKPDLRARRESRQRRVRALLADARDVLERTARAAGRRKLVEEHGDVLHDGADDGDGGGHAVPVPGWAFRAAWVQQSSGGLRLGAPAMPSRPRAANHRRRDCRSPGRGDRLGRHEAPVSDGAARR